MFFTDTSSSDGYKDIFALFNRIIHGFTLAIPKNSVPVWSRETADLQLWYRVPDPLIDSKSGSLLTKSPHVECSEHSHSICISALQGSK
jgi:hypothetical protein